MRMKAGARVAAGALVAGVLALGGPGAVQAQPEGRVDVVSASGFGSTLRKLTTALKKEGMMIVATIDHQNMLKMVGASIKGSKTVEFGKPDMGKMLLPMAPEIGLEMPGKVYVWERADGKTIVSFRSVAGLYASYGSPQIAEAGKMMDMMCQKFAEAAAK